VPIPVRRVADTIPPLSALRPSRAEASYRRIWIQPEDDVPHVRDPLQHAGHRAALLPAQITVAASLVAAAGRDAAFGRLPALLRAAGR
jgi:hypothetical protein